MMMANFLGGGGGAKTYRYYIKKILQKLSVRTGTGITARQTLDDPTGATPIRFSDATLTTNLAFGDPQKSIMISFADQIEVMEEEEQ